MQEQKIWTPCGIQILDSLYVKLLLTQRKPPDEFCLYRLQYQSGPISGTGHYIARYGGIVCELSEIDAPD